MTRHSPLQTDERLDAIGAADFNVWEGVFSSFAEAPAVGQGFDGPIWRDRSVTAARDTAAQARARRPLDYALRQRNALLPALVAALLATQERVNILDFGGGPGTSYLLLAQTMPDAVGRIDYTIVDVDSICAAGRELFNGKTGPTFCNGLPDTARFDIVHAASVLQYIEDWRSLVARLAGYNARFLSLADMFIGDFKTYVTLQNYYGSKIRHWFFNADEFIDAVQGKGYALALRSHCDAKILDRYGPLPMQNFPPALRLVNTSNLLFCRGSKA